HRPGAGRERLDDRAAVGPERLGVTLVGTGALTVGRLPPRRGIQGRVHGSAPAFGRPETSTVTMTRRIRVNGVCASRYRLPRTPQQHAEGTVVLWVRSRRVSQDWHMLVVHVRVRVWAGSGGE